MKYIISESVLTKVIDKYLNRLYKNLEKHRDENNVHIEMWYDGSDIVFYYNGRSGIFAVSYSFFEGFRAMFPLSEKEIKKILKNWVILNLDADPSIEVMTFAEAALRGLLGL